MSKYTLPFNPALIGSFLAVAEIGKIAQAAKILNLSQPAVTAQIAKFERELKVKCFSRSVEGVRLTNEGLAIYEIAKSIKANIDAAAQVTSENKEFQGLLKIAASTTIGDHLLPPILTEFAGRFPSVDIQLNIASTKIIIDLASLSDPFIGLVEGLSRAPRLKMEKLVSDEIFPVAHPEVAVTIRAASDLKKYPIIWREPGSGTRAVVEKEICRHLRKTDISYKYQFGSSAAVKVAVLNKLGIGFLSRSSVESELSTGRLKIIPIRDLRIERQFSWVFPSPVLTDIQSKFVDFVRTRFVI